MPNQLEQLKAFSAIAVETADAQVIDVSSNVVISTNAIVNLVKQQNSLMTEAISEAKKHHWSSYTPNPKPVVLLLTVNLLKKILPKTSGHIFIELDIALAFDTEGLINQARELHDLCRNHRLDASRVALTIPATWPGIEAARRLQRDRINTHLSMVYSFIQAQAAGDAAAFALSMPVDAATRWYKNNEPADYYESNDPGVQILSHIHNNLKCLGYNTKIMASGFDNLNQLRTLAGGDYISLTPEQLHQLSQDQTALERKLDKPTEIYERPPEVTEKDFHWHLTSSAMAYNQLGNDIRKLANEQRELEDLVKQIIEAEEYVS